MWLAAFRAVAVSLGTRTQRTERTATYIASIPRENVAINSLFKFHTETLCSYAFFSSSRPRLLRKGELFFDEHTFRVSYLSYTLRPLFVSGFNITPVNCFLCDDPLDYALSADRHSMTVL